MKAERIVLTGGPCCGKTTIIKELEKRGYNVVHEVSRKVLGERKYIPATKKEWEIRQRIMFERGIKEENATRGKFFLDRSVIDGLAYIEYYGLNIPEIFWKNNLRERYRYVFLLDRLPFEDDGLRSESGDECAKRIHDLIEKAYTRLGYEIIEVPLFGDEFLTSVEKRIKFILEKVNK